MSESRLCIRQPLWNKLIAELRKRGRGERESGAFLLGEVGSAEITEFICFDELDPQALDTGIVVFDSSGFVPLWKHCSEGGMKVLADVHTHPRTWTGLSELDIEHPMIHQSGHIALIVPNYAVKHQRTLLGVGVHEYLGSKQWRSWQKKSKVIQIIP